MRGVLLAALLTTIASAADAQTITCTAPQTSMVQAELLFGRNVDGRFGVTEKAWAHFLAHEVTPRFPDGLTVYDAAGQYRDSATGKIARERTKVLMILFENGGDAMQRLGAIVDAYKKRFRQKSVGVVIKPACAEF